MKLSKVMERIEELRDEYVGTGLLYNKLKQLKARIIQDIINEGYPDPPPNVELEIDRLSKKLILIIRGVYYEDNS